MEDYKPLDPREIVVDGKLRDQRLKICKSCNHYTKVHFCSLCKCFIPAKTWLRVSSCPIKKWPDDN